MSKKRGPTVKKSSTAPVPLLLIDGLQVGYGLPVCPPVTVNVGPGTVVAVIGANGSGKSTLLRTVVGLLPPLKGRLELFGKAIDDRSRVFRADVAVELGDDAFFPTLTVREHLMLICFGHGVEDSDAVTEALLEDFGLTERSEALPAALSSGQRRRLLLAGVFARPRRLLILDEPEQRLDSSMRDDLTQRLVEEREAGGAVLMATHDPQMVRGAATSVVVISDHDVRVLDADAGAGVILREL
jgi:ABC-type multidrug transport system ATPase subunit